MKKKTQRIVVILVLLALLLSILVPALSMLSSAVTQDDISAIRNNLNSIAQQKQDVEAQLKSIREDLSQAEQTVELIQGQITLTEQQINASQQLLEEYDAQILNREQEIQELEAREAEQYQQFYAQVRWMEETGSVSYLSILFRASSFSEMLEHAMLIMDIMEYNNRIIEQLETTQAELSRARDEVQADRDAQAEVQSQLEGQKAELEAHKAEAMVLLNQIAASESEYAQKAAQLAAAEAEMEQELKDAERKYAAQIAGLTNTGEWYWPLPGIYYISSIFGGRISPINGRWESHTGTDIPAAGGTNIHAAQDGVVTTSGYNRSYGNYCIINHGNGYVTLYAHMRTLPIVGAGEYVSKGQVIGYVGTTGDSTGNHLHFELRVNGVRDNVLRLYPTLPYTGPYVSTIREQLGL